MLQYLHFHLPESSLPLRVFPRVYLRRMHMGRMIVSAAQSR
jgi:hypothetical protein